MTDPTLTNVTLHLWSEKFGVEIWVVPEFTGKDRIEFIQEEVDRFALVLDTFAGDMVSFTTDDGRELVPVPGWEERIRRLRLRYYQVQYDIVLEREREIRIQMDDPVATDAERDKLSRAWKRETEQLNALVEQIRDHGHTMSGDEVQNGFGTGESCGRKSTNLSPSLSEAPPFKNRPALSQEGAKDLLHRNQRPRDQRSAG